MKYALCIKTEDKNLMHILQRGVLKSPLYAGYTVVADADDEAAAFVAVAAFIQQFCDTGAVLSADAFKTWMGRGRQ